MERVYTIAFDPEANDLPFASAFSHFYRFIPQYFQFLVPSYRAARSYQGSLTSFYALIILFLTSQQPKPATVLTERFLQPKTLPDNLSKWYILSGRVVQYCKLASGDCRSLAAEVRWRSRWVQHGPPWSNLGGGRG